MSSSVTTSAVSGWALVRSALIRFKATFAATLSRSTAAMMIQQEGEGKGRREPNCSTNQHNARSESRMRSSQPITPAAQAQGHCRMHYTAIQSAMVEGGWRVACSPSAPAGLATNAAKPPRTHPQIGHLDVAGYASYRGEGHQTSCHINQDDTC